VGANAMGADITGAASTATTTAHPIVILRSMTILQMPPRYSENAMQKVQMTNDLISDSDLISVS
jgi:hypothetical protein